MGVAESGDRSHLYSEEGLVVWASPRKKNGERKSSSNSEERESLLSEPVIYDQGC